jgi:putative cardiolipin synthase
VTLLTNSLAANDEPLVHTGYARYRQSLLVSSVELYELSPARTTANARFGAFGKSLGRLHAKALTIDQRLVFIGSMNLDPRSATQNTEMGVVVDCPELAQEVLRIVDISKRQNSYRLRISPSTGALEWLTFDGDREVVLKFEPETSFLHRVYILLVAPFIPEGLL